MYPYPYTNNQVTQYPTFTPMNVNIPEIQYVASPESTDTINVPPNKTAVFFNQGKDEFYILSTDASGSRVRTDFTYTKKAKDSKSEFVTRGEFDELKEMIMSKTKKSTQKATEVTEDE